jgi:arylsulfatase
MWASAMGCYGGPIETPNIDRIASDGAVHAVAYHGAVFADPFVFAYGAQPHPQLDGASRPRSGSRMRGTIPAENGMLPEILGELGWNTWSARASSPNREMNVAWTRRNWPSSKWV